MAEAFDSSSVLAKAVRDLKDEQKELEGYRQVCRSIVCTSPHDCPRLDSGMAVSWRSIHDAGPACSRLFVAWAVLVIVSHAARKSFKRRIRWLG